MTPRVELLVYFLIGLSFTICMPVFTPSLKIFYFIPFLIRSYYLMPLISCLFIALGTGFIIDLLSSHSRFGLYSINYVITTYLTYGLKRNFFEDNGTTLPFMTFFFSVTSTAIQILLLFLLDKQTIPLSLSFLFFDFLLMPLYDIAFATCLFTVPAFLFGQPARKGSDYFT